MVSRQSAGAEGCDHTVLPHYRNEGCAVSASTFPNDLAAVVNGPGDVGTLGSKARKWDGIAVFPQHGVMRCGAVSRVTHDLAPFVDALRLPVWIASHSRKSMGLAAFPFHRRIRLGNDAGWACGIRNSCFRKSCDLSTVIDGEGLRVISTDRWESAHVSVSPKKRATRKSCAKTANVLTIRVWNSCFGETDRIPAIVEPAIAHETVVSSKRAQVDPEPVDV